jgi:hypothetical protein
MTTGSSLHFKGVVTSTDPKDQSTKEMSILFSIDREKVVPNSEASVVIKVVDLWDNRSQGPKA